MKSKPIIDAEIIKSKLNSSLLLADDVYVPKGAEPNEYCLAIASDIRSNQCEPFTVNAIVKEPGFPDIPLHATIQAACVAKRPGYWLAYETERDRFYCFWGESVSDLGAHGVYGSPLYCWTA